MIFSSSFFLLYFLPIFLLIYYLIDKRYKNLTILLASIFFYSWGAPKFVFVIVGSTILDFYLVRLLYKSEKKNQRRLLLFVSVFINLGLLAYFKYANFFIETVNDVLGFLGKNTIKWTEVLLPIGISFYTFQTITYSVDVYRRVHKPLDKVTDYLLYIMSFPQMIAGPIIRFNSIADQITSRIETIDDKLNGFYRFCIGLAKKVLIANVMGAQADLIMNGNVSNLDFSTAWLGIIAYTFQIYFDFSGYSDMAIGLGRMMGFKFPENFNSPYISKSITEFWRRWHMTLGAFMRDYLYIPLGGNRVSSKTRMYFNLWIVFLLSGLWHGASWNFVVWGAFHGLFLILDKMFLLKIYERIGGLLSMLITFFITMIGWTIFRLEDFQVLKTYLTKLFRFQGVYIPEALPSFYPILIVAVFFSFITYFNLGKKVENYVFWKENYSVKASLLNTVTAMILLLLSISSITSSGFNPFIYFRF
jgi:alginate O-acetyltransferase complex protein AlgI